MYYFRVFFQRIRLDSDYIRAFEGSLVGLSGKWVQVKGHVMLEMTFDLEAIIKTIKVKYLVMDPLTLYNVILGKPSINLLGVVLSTLHLSLKYSLLNGRVCSVWGDQEAAKECYQNIMEMRREHVS